MTSSDGGKGSGRRKEDLKKVNEGFDRIFGLSKFEQRLKAEKEVKEAMNEEHEYHSEDGEEYDDTCTWCGGCGEGDYDGSTCKRCNGTGVEPFEGVDDDYI